VVHDTVEAYDPATDSWVTQTSLPSGREYPAVVGASSGRVYVVGGVVGRWSGSPNYRSTVFEGTLAPDELLCDDVSTPACDPGTLDAGMHYYWYVIATDNHGASTEGEVWHFTTADSANEPPTISDLPDREVPMNSSADDAIDLWAYANDAEDADDELTFTISNSPAAGAGVTIDSNRYVDINPVTGWTGTTEVEIQVEDSGGLTDADSFQATITNSPPTISGLPDQELRMNSSADNAIDLWAYASDAEDSVAGLAFTISNAPASGAGVSIDSNRYVDISPTTDWTGEIEVEIEVEDTGGLTDSGTFRVRVRAYSVYLPLVMRRWPPIPDVPVLSAINNPDGDGNYTVNWGSVDLADTYTLQEDDSAAFSNPTTRYTGSGTSWDATGKAPGTYHYRVKASNAWGDSGWSNVESITVPVPELEPCPAGTIEYTGTTDQDRPVKICTDPAFSAVKQVTLNYRVACEGRTTEGTVTVTSEAGWPIENRSFSIEVTYRFDIAGTFNPGFNDVNGTWQGIIAECSGWPGPCWEVCRGPVGEWSGTRQP
jgi:hypothetical protein